MRYFSIGKITGTHGIKGAFRVFPTTDDPKRFELLNEVIFDFRGKRETFTIEKTAYQKNMVLLTVKEINDINIAEKYKGAEILIPEGEAVPLAENEFYADDMYGLDVYTIDNEYLGKITNIYFTAANDVYGIKDEKHPENKELLLPAIKDVVKNIDIQERKMTVELIEGLR